MRRLILMRDASCMASVLGFDHICRDRFGRAHSRTATHLLTIEHVHEGYGMAGKRAASDPAHLIAVCALINLRPPTKAMREAFRLYLARVAAWVAT